LLGAVSLLGGIAYLTGGEIVGNMLAEGGKQEEKRYRAVDDAILADTIRNIETVKEVEGLDTAVQNMYKLVDDVRTVEAESLNSAAAHEYREAIARKLDSLAALEEKVTHQVKSRMVAQVKADVTKQFQDKKTKEQALEQALSVLSAGKSAKMGSDVVGDVFKHSIQNYRNNYSKMSPDKDELLQQLQKEIAAIVSPPEIHATGGNVNERPLLK
jgi:hypothetical protein